MSFMSYSSYNAYIVQSNAAVLLGLAIINHLTFTFKIWPLEYLLGTTLFILLESFLSLACANKIWGVSKVYILPYIDKTKLPYSQYLFVPGPATKIIWNFLRSEFNKLLGKMPIERSNMTPVAAHTPVPAKDQFMLHFPTDVNQSNGTLNYIDSLVTTPIRTHNDPSLLADNIDRERTQKLKNGTPLKDYLAKNPAAAHLARYGQLMKSSRNTIPELQFTSALRILEPKEYRARILWFLNPTPEIVDDLRIMQILDFRKYWSTYNETFCGFYYDKMLDILHKKLFEPLAKSIEHYNTLLARSNTTIAKCPRALVAYSMITPGLNYNSAFTFSEVVDFITLAGRFTGEVKQYVVNRIIEFSHGNQLAAYRFTQSNPGMPTDTQIILHLLITYLSIKEPKAIPPLVPADINFFKFLLLYIYITPELNHWGVFN